MPLDHSYFEKLGPFESYPEIAVALSGGADSLALTLSLSEWIKTKQGKLTAITIDHNLRPESSLEAKQVGVWLQEYKIQHVILKADISNRKNISANARDERYRLLTDWCRENQILHLFIAHTLDDQAENFLIRLTRGSGIDGLSAIAPISYYNNIRILRPFLDIPKKKLIAFLEAHKQPWIEDPTNHNPQFLRTKVREFINSEFLVSSEIWKMRLKNTAFQLEEDRQLIEKLVQDFIVQKVEVFGEGFVKIDYNAFIALPKALALKILAKLLMFVGGVEYKPRYKSLTGLYRNVIVRQKKVANTLAHCQVTIKKDIIYILPELKNISKKVTKDLRSYVRFKLSINTLDISLDTEELIIDYLGAVGFMQVIDKIDTAKFTKHSIFYHLISLKKNNKVIYIPYLNYLDWPNNVTPVTFDFQPIVKL